MTKIKSTIKSNLYKKDLYTREDIDYLINKHITEYDIKSANISIARYYNLLPKETIDHLSTLNKQDRVIQVGKIQRDDKIFNEELNNGFEYMRRNLFLFNDIEDDDVLSVKKDAVFIIDKILLYTKFDELEFAQKNSYTSYHKFGKIELYYNSSTNDMAVKGIDDNKLDKNEKFISILKRFFKIIESGDSDSFVRLMKNFSEDYKNRNLTYEYYREFNPFSDYSLTLGFGKHDTIHIDTMDESLDGYVNINYNYMHYILPLIQRHYFDKNKG